MIKVDIDSLIGSDDSYYSFVVGVAKRARDIADEQGKRIKEYTEMEKGKSSSDKSTRHLPDELSAKPVRLAIEELNNGKYRVEIGKHIPAPHTNNNNNYHYNIPSIPQDEDESEDE